MDNAMELSKRVEIKVYKWVFELLKEKADKLGTDEEELISCLVCNWLDEVE